MDKRHLCNPKVPSLRHQKSYVKLAKALGYSVGEHATTINFQGKPTDDDLVTVGINAHLSPQCCRQILDEIREATQELQKYIL